MAEVTKVKKPQFESMADFQKHLNQRCFDDPGFRKRLMADSNGTIAEELGVSKDQLKDTAIRIHENTEKVWNFNVLSEELDDKLLEQVSLDLAT